MNTTFQFSDFNFELQVLIQAGEIALDISKKPVLEELLKRKTVDWSKVYHLACIHQIRPLLLRGVSRLENSTVPSDILQQLKADCFRISARGLANTNEMLRLLEIFKENNILAVPYKGAYLANKYYGDFGLREFGDIDLFVKEEDIFRIKEVMLKEAYVPEFELTQEQEKILIKTNCEFNFDLYNSNQELLFHIEPHYRSNNIYDGMGNMTLNDFIEQLENYKLNHTVIKSFSHEDNLLLTISHHGIKEGWVRLKYVFDIYAILIKMSDKIDWDYLMITAKKFNILTPLSIGLHLTNNIFNQPYTVNTSIQTTKAHILAINRLRQLNISPKKLTYYYIFIFKLKNLDSFLSKIKVLTYKITYPNAKDIQFFALPTSLLFLYIIVRPIRGIKNAISLLLSKKKL